MQQQFQPNMRIEKIRVMVCDVSANSRRKKIKLTHLASISAPNRLWWGWFTVSE